MKKGRWLFVLLTILIFICLGTVYSWSIFRKPVEQLYRVGATQSGLPYMVFLASYAAVMPFMGHMIERFGPSRMMIAGGIIVGAGWFFSGYAKNILTMVLTFGVISGGGVGVVNGAPIAVISKWFPDKKGFAVGLSLSGFGLSPFVTAPLAEFLLASQGLLRTMRVLGVIFLIVITVLSIPFRFPKESQDSIVKFHEEGTESGEIDTAGMLKSPAFYILWTCFALGTFTGLMAVGIAGPVGEELVGLNPKTTIFMISIFAVFNGIGRPLFGWLMDKLGFVKSSLISFFIIMLASSIMIAAPTHTAMLYIITFSLLWLTLGGWLAIAPVATAAIFGSRNYTVNYGYVFTAYGVGAVGGVLTSGIVRDTLGNYIYAFYPMAVSAILGSIIALSIIKQSGTKIS